MPLDEEVISRAARFKIDAMEQVLTYQLPAVHRLAVALTGRRAAGSAVARQVLSRSLKFVHTWDAPETVERWFYHHTIQSTRPYADDPPDPRKDVLLLPGTTADLQAVAFVKALRSLPPQQREAYLLTHGEQLPPRPVATAMDCSLDASANHLVVATRTLKDIGGTEYPRLELSVATAYASLTPEGDETVSVARSAIRRHVWPRRIKRILSTALLLAIIAAIAWIVLKVRPTIEF
ncbi:MAG TPA: sigma factor-like helix-turn-helix DNA-binding protein [Tepidisphaeraceae bacterium]|nr:sigma factor-like helix-turn-helix DNA-binding protein [Tepidisphaeraceae bacterium]